MPNRVIVTSAGLAEAIATLNSGFNLSITTYRLGSAFNYVPLASDTGLRGSTLFTGAITEVIRTSYDTLTFKIVVPTNVGPFLIGEIGIYSSTGVLFALVSLETRFAKTVTTSSQRGNVFRAEIPVQLDNSAGTPIDPPETVVVAKLNEVGTPNLLPDAVLASGNTYIIQNPSNPNAGRRAIAFFPTGDSLFQFTNYTYWLRNLTVSTSTPADGRITFTSTMPIPPIVDVGDFIIQWKSGAVMSQCAYVTDVTQSGNTFSLWYTTPTRTNIPVGAVFDLHVHNEFLYTIMTAWVKDWTASVYQKGMLVKHNNKVWIADANMTGTQVPGVNTSWQGFRMDHIAIPTTDLSGLIQTTNIPYATQAQAEGLSSSVTIMSPLRTLNAVNARLAQLNINTSGLVTGGGNLGSSPTVTVTEASQAQAEAMSASNVVITPRRVSNAISAFTGARSILTAGLATGGGPLSSTQTITVPIATQVEAEALTGQVDTVAMTPLRTYQSVHSYMGSRTISTGGLASGGGNLGANRTITVSIATQAQAEATTSQSNAVAMTPLRTYQAIHAYFGNRSVTGSGLATGGGPLSSNQVITVTEATTAEAAALNSGNVVITPRRVANAVDSLLLTRSILTSGLASGGGSLNVDRTITVAVATQAQAEALTGQVDTVAMTPLRTYQSVHSYMGGRTISGGGLASGGGPLNADRTITVAIASQAQAEASSGQSNAVAMTPLRTYQAIHSYMGSRTVTTSGLASGGGPLNSNQIITVPIATQAQAEASSGQLDTVAMTPLKTYQAIHSYMGSRTISTSGLASGGGPLRANRTITVTEASAAEAAALTSGSVVITPRRVASAVNGALASVTIGSGGLATGGGPLSSNPTITVPIATAGQAAAQTDQLNTVAMTPLRTYDSVHGYMGNRSILTSGLASGGGPLNIDRTVTVTVATQVQAEAQGSQSNAVAMTPLRTWQSVHAYLGARSVTGSGLASGGGTLNSNQSIIVTEASVAEASAGSSASVVITPRRISPAVSAVLGSININTAGLASGGGPINSTQTITVPIATQAEAQALSSNAVAITPLRAQQAIHSYMGGRTISGGGLVTGGGTLNGNRTLTVTVATSAQVTAGTASNVAVTPLAMATSLAEAGLNSSTSETTNVNSSVGGRSGFHNFLGTASNTPSNFAGFLINCVQDANNRMQIVGDKNQSSATYNNANYYLRKQVAGNWHGFALIWNSMNIEQTLQGWRFYVKFPNGLMIQGAQTPLTHNSLVTFQWAFPVACIGVMCQDYNVNLNLTWQYHNIAVLSGSITRTAFRPLVQPAQDLPGNQISNASSDSFVLAFGY